MPLDFNALFARYRVAYFLQWRSIGESLHKIAEWLTKRLKQTREREVATRGYQTFDFSGSALAVSIDDSQHGALGSRGESPPSGFLETAAAPFVEFWRGLLLAPAMIEAEQALPGAISAMARFIDMVVASIERFTHPDKSLFDIKAGKRWDDLFGELALFFRVVNDPATVKQVQTFSSGYLAIKDVLAEHFPSKPKEAGQGGGLADVSRWILGGALVIPLASQLLADLGRTLLVVARFRLVDWASSILNEVYALRRGAIDFLYVTLFEFGRQALEWVVIAKSDVIASLGLYADFLSNYFEQIEAWLTKTGSSLKTFVDSAVTFLYKLGEYLDKWVDVDLGAAVLGFFGEMFVGDVSFRLSNISEWQAEPAKAQEWLHNIEENNPKLTFIFHDRFAALREVVETVANTPQNWWDEAAPPDLSKIRAPDLHDAFFDAYRADKLRDSLAHLGPTFKENLAAIWARA